MWSPRVYPFIHIAKGLQKRFSGSWLSPLVVTQRILVWYPAWQVPLGLHCILNLSMLYKGQEVIISFLYVCTYPTSASTSTTWLGEKCWCTDPPERGHLSVNIHCPPSNRSRLLLILSWERGRRKWSEVLIRSLIPMWKYETKEERYELPHIYLNTRMRTHREKSK